MKKLLQTNTTQIGLALATFASRLGTLPANVNPLGSFGFFGTNPILFFASIFAFDFFVKGLYPGFWLTYIGFAAYPLLGRLSRHKTSHQLLALPTASFLFFLLSNLGVWFYWYELTFENLILCYTLALPFYQRTLLGDVFFGYGYMLVRAISKRYQLSTKSSQAPSF